MIAISLLERLCCSLFCIAFPVFGHDKYNRRVRSRAITHSLVDLSIISSLIINSNGGDTTDTPASVVSELFKR